MAAGGPAGGFTSQIINVPNTRFMGEANRTEYFDQLNQSAKIMQSSMCYVVEWYKEALPLETSDGLGLERALNDKASLGGAGENAGQYLPPVDCGPAPALNILIFPDSYGYCKGILKLARKWSRVAECKIIETPVEKLTAEEMKTLVDPGWDLILFAYGIDTPEDNTAKTILDFQNTLGRTYFIFLSALVKASKPSKKVCCITCDIFADEPEIHEETGVSLVTNAFLFGFSNSARYEIDPPLQFIDTEWALLDENVPLLASEVFREASFGKNSVRILNTGRYVLRQMPSFSVQKNYETEQKAFEFPSSGIIAMTGGNGALAMVFGDWILNKIGELNVSRKLKGEAPAKLRLKFLSRSAKVPEANMPGWLALEDKAKAVGVSVAQVKCDISKPDATKRFIAECTPKLVGFIHAAGVLSDGMMYTQSWDRYELVWNPKSRAALYIHEALETHANPNLKFLWLFSSTSVYGNPSATNYSAANSYMDALARHRKATGKPCVAIQWAAWESAGMAANMTGAARERIFSGPQPPFSNEEGFRGLEAGLRTGLPYFAVLKWNAVAILGQTFAGDTPTAAFARNMASKYAPLPHDKMGDMSHGMSGIDTYVKYVRHTAGPEAENLIHDNFIQEQTYACTNDGMTGAEGAAQGEVEMSDTDVSEPEEEEEAEVPGAPSPEEKKAARCQKEQAKQHVKWNFISNDTVIAGHEKVAPGVFYGLDFPWNADLLEDMGPKWLTKALHTAGTLDETNKIVKITVEQRVKITAGNCGAKFLFDVKYKKKRKGLHNKLFAKIPFPLQGAVYNDRLGNSVNKQPMDFFEINTYRILESALPVKTPKFYFGDISNETSNFILIAERIPFAEISGVDKSRTLQPFEVEGPYEKCKDWQLRGSIKEYYMLVMEQHAKLAGAHKAGKMGSPELLAQSVRPTIPLEHYGMHPHFPTGGSPKDVQTKLKVGMKFFSETAKVIYPAYVVTEEFKNKYMSTMIKLQAYNAEIDYWKNAHPDYVALGHQNLNMDNAFFWRDNEGKLDCGLFDWGGFGELSLAHKLWWCMNVADFDEVKANLRDYIDRFVVKYEEYGGPGIDRERMFRGMMLTAMQNLYFMVLSVPNALRQCQAKEWATIENRDDPRIAGDIDGKTTLRTTITALGNGLRVIEELQGDKVLDDWIQENYVGEFKQTAKTDAIIYGEG